MNLEEKLRSLGLTLPPPPSPAGSYTPVVLEGKTAYLSGQIAKTGEGRVVAGHVGRDLSLEEGQQAAQMAALNALSLIHKEIGEEKVSRILRMVGYVQAAPDFFEIPAVINGASDLFQKIFGAAGVHARSAVGVSNLPMRTAVELELTLLLK